MFSLVPRCHGVRVTEVDLDPGVDGELGVLGHLFALIPGQRLPQVFGETLYGRCQGDPDSFGGVAIGEGEQHHVP